MHKGLCTVGDWTYVVVSLRYFKLFLRKLWDDRIEEFSAFTRALDKMVNVLNAMDDTLKRLGQNVKEKDLKQMTCSATTAEMQPKPEATQAGPSTVGFCKHSSIFYQLFLIGNIHHRPIPNMAVTLRKANARRQARLSLAELKARDPRAFALKKKIWRVFLQRRSSQREYKQDARKYWNDVKKAQNRRIALEKLRSAQSEGGMWELDERYCESRLATLESLLRRHFNDNPIEYFENLYLELMQWKSAHRPAASPLDHPKAILDSLIKDFESIRHSLWHNIGVGPLLTRATRLHDLTVHLQSCVRDFSLALSAEELINDLIDLGRLYHPVETKHSRGELKYQRGGLTQKYEEVLHI
ncbi:hypothetical protein AAF712_014100 [Marasmius tenuissimus]|uniref:Uncharacterized protein n=1 Tax=Marasmius tenuissimus TaxID=585030 RepID=A0ABR2ZE23_9AGAR